MNDAQEILAVQKEWAVRHEKQFHSHRYPYYLDSIDANLWEPLSDRTQNAFMNAGGSELQDKGDKPAKMKALHSSGALAVNFFSYWTTENVALLLAALCIDEDRMDSLDFEPKFPTGLRGNPPNPDYAIWPRSGGVFAIESKFTEWVSKHTKIDTDFREKYLRNSPGLWEQQKLPHCQKLAEEIGAEKDDGKPLFQFLDAAQLLKHALGLATIHGDRFSLYYLYYDWRGERSEAHKEEIKCFAARVGEETRFKALSYQKVYKRLRASEQAEPEYLHYLKDRYFSGKGAPA